MLTTIVTALLTSISASGIAAYIGKTILDKNLLKQKNNYDTQLKEIQADLDKGSHIHRVQFEKEFQIYEEIWKLVVKIQKSIFLLNNNNRGEEEAEIIRKSIDENHNIFYNIYENNKPFYPEEIYNSLDRIFGSSVQDRIRHDDGATQTDFSNYHEINSEIDNCAKMIRKRINLIQVSE